MATTQGYQQVMVLPTMVPHPQTRSDFIRKGVRLGGWAVGLQCAVYLAIAGFMFIIPGIVMLSVNSTFHSKSDSHSDSNFHSNFHSKFDSEFDKHFPKDFEANFDSKFGTNFPKNFDSNFDSKFDSNVGSQFDKYNEPLKIVGIVMLLIGIGMIIGSIVMCYIGHREYKKFTQRNAGRVLNSNPSAGVVADSYPMTSKAYTPNVAQVSPCSSPGVQQAASYQPPVAGQTTPHMMYPGGPPVGQMPYPAAPPSEQMPYPTAASFGQVPYPSSSLGKTPYPEAPGPAIAQVPPYSGQQQYATNPPYQAQAPDFQESAPV